MTHRIGRFLKKVAGARVSRARAVFRTIATCPMQDTKRLRLSDLQIAHNRMLFGLGAVAYVWLLSAIGDLDSPTPMILDAVYLLLATSALFTARLSQRGSDIFRKVMLLVDVSAISSAFITGGPMAAPVLFLYIWLTIGYGFRYGIIYLRLAAAASLGGVLTALLWTDYWHTQPFTSIGMLMLAVVIPPYLELLMRRAIRANEAARSANHSKTLMLAGLGHALRAPLGSILTAAQSMSASVLNPSQSQAVEAIQAAAGSLTHELDDFLDMSRLDVGRMPKNIASFAVKGLIIEALSAAGAEGASKGVAVSWHITPEVPERVWSERRYLLRSLTNIIENAVRFTATGSVLVTTYVIRRPPGVQCLRIEVVDTGIGIRAEARKRIFDNFTQADPDILHIFGGAGLGLAVARRLIESLDGQIGVESVEGQGSMFWFEVPVNGTTAWEATERRIDDCTVIILTADAESLIPFAGRLEILGANTFLSERANWWDVIPAGMLEKTERVVMVVDGRDVDLLELAYVLQQGQLLDHVPLIALTKHSSMPDPLVRRRFVTSVSPDAPDAHLVSALYLVGASTRETEMGSRDLRRGGRYSGPQAAGGRNRVLVADTSRTNALILSKVLEQDGFSSLVVDSGESALNAAEQEAFDIIIINIDQPAIDGLETVKMLRFEELGVRRNTILTLTSREDPETVRLCKEAGCDDMLLHPIEANKVRDLVAHLFAHQLHSGPAANLRSSIIRPISSHPRFRVGPGPVVTDFSFPYLTSIGGSPFVNDVVRLFISEAEQVIAKLSDALERDDVDTFRNTVISLAESAAVMGAARLTELCKTADVLSKDRLTLGDRALLATLRSEVARVVKGIKDHIPAAAGLPDPAANDVKPGAP